MADVRVFIADDHELVRVALKQLIEDEPGMTVVGEAGDGEQAIEAVPEVSPDVLLLDMRMPGMDGVKICQQIRELCPDTRVLVLTSFDDDEEIFGVLAAGASGYLLKDSPADNVVQAVRSVAEGQAVFDDVIARRIINSNSPSVSHDQAEELRKMISEREMDVLRLMAKGMSNKEIGRELWIGETTVKTHVSHILRKLGQSDRTQAVLAAVRIGLVPMSEE